MNRFRLSVAAAWLVFLASPVGLAQPAGGDPVVAESGNLSLTASQAKRLLDGLDPDARRQAQADPTVLPRLVRAQVLQMILLDEARGKKWDQNPDIAARADQAHDAVIANTWLASLTAPPTDYPSEADIQAAYEANKPRLMVPRQFQLAQIFVAVPAGAAKAAEDDAQRKARDIRATAVKPKADFGAIARKQSEDANSAANGGELPWTREDQLVAAVKDTVAGLQDGAISDPIRLPDGWHVLKLIGTRPAAPAALGDVHDQLARALRQQRQQQNERTFVDDLLRRRPIQLNEIQLQRDVAK